MEVRERRRAANPLFGALSIEEARVEERIRTLALCVVGLAVVGGVLSYLRAMLVPLVLASATRYLLAFPVDLLTRRPMHCFGMELCARPSHAEDAPWLVRCASDLLCRLVLPRPLAVLATLCVTGSICGWIGVVVFDSVRTFAARADTYSEQVRRLFDGALAWLDAMELDSALRLEKLHELAGQVPLTNLVMSVVEGLLSLLSNMLLVLLFTVYLMLGRDASATLPADDVVHQVDDRIRAFIRGKVSLSLLVGTLTAAVLWMLNLELWLLFAVLAFWLNFIPNMGAVVATLLPVPVAAFDPSQTPLSAVLVFVLPLGVHLAVGSVLEPLVFGNSLDLHPVVVLLSLMLWGTLWGVPGLVLAVPLTAVLRIHLAHVDHPLPRYLARVLVGREIGDGASTLGGSDVGSTVGDMSDLASLPDSLCNGDHPHAALHLARGEHRPAAEHLHREYGMAAPLASLPGSPGGVLGGIPAGGMDAKSAGVAVGLLGLAAAVGGRSSHLAAARGAAEEEEEEEEGDEEEGLLGSSAFLTAGRRQQR